MFTEKKQSLAFVNFENETVSEPFFSSAPEPTEMSPTASAYFTAVRYLLEMPLVVSYRDGVRMERHQDFKEARKEGYQPINGNPLRWGVYGYTVSFCQEMGWDYILEATVDREAFDGLSLDDRIDHVLDIRSAVADAILASETE